jgi:hypothetical protein
MSTNIYIELQGFISCNNVSYKKMVKMLSDFSKSKITSEAFLEKMSKKLLDISEVSPSQELKDVIIQVQNKNNIDHPIMMDHLMDIIDDFDEDKKFIKFLDKTEMSRKNKKKIKIAR